MFLVIVIRIIAFAIPIAENQPQRETKGKEREEEKKPLRLVIDRVVARRNLLRRTVRL
jgi:hypothetical protein